jgi:hypothetical protein
MRDFIYVGSTPPEEECAQLGTEGYLQKSGDEMARYIALIRDVCGPEPEGARLEKKGSSHDFGIYYEVVCWYDTDKPKSQDYAYHVESRGPRTWLGEGGERWPG